MTKEKLQWHSAFLAALHIEFENELHLLNIEAEHLLGRKPMQMDVLIIKKEKETAIQKNIGRIFRQHNIIEYKNPGDYLSLNDFYKVYGYTCFYQSDTAHVNEIKPEELTITYACGRYPRKLIRHLEAFRRIKVRKQAPGIYYLSGDAFPIQLLITKELQKEENYWLQSLRDDFSVGDDLMELAEKYESVKQNPYYSAVMDLIIRANWRQIKEEKKMCEALRELFADELIESKNQGIEEGIKKGIEKGALQAKMEAASNLLNLLDIHTIAETVGLPVEKVRQLKYR